WRKSLDFQAILDIHSIKRQINSHHTNSSIGVKGHNIKLGRGGIREIEFYAQTQQLIWGGKNPDLRTSGSCESLKALTKAGFVEEKVSIRLTEAYHFLRKLEHRLQMTNDAQTHTLPKAPEELHNLAVFTGYDDTETFKNEVLSHLKAVELYYAQLFEEAPSLSDNGNLVFTGSEHDPDTLETLCNMGFSNAKSVSDTIKGWHHGRYKAMRTTRARELLTELTPELLETLCETVQPDDAFFRFDDFLKGLPSGVQLFTLFHSNPKLLRLVAEIMGDAPRLAKYLSKRPSLLDNVLAPDFFAPLPSLEYLEKELKNILHHASGYEDILDKCRRWVKDRSFQVGVQTLQNIIDGKQAGVALTNIADVVLNKLQPYVEEEFAKKHGYIKGSGLAIIALGKMGGQEMTATSDADLIFVYDVPNEADKSDGKHPLPVSTYFARLVQRCVNSITSLTAEGRLWEVDMRLRPSGNAGPVATNLDAFAKYHKEAAWTWEHMALTKARAITGSKKLKKQVNEIITDTLCRKRECKKLKTDVSDMRNLIFSEHGTTTIWNIKHVRGGSVDIGFIVQYLQLKHAHQNSAILCTTTSEAIKQLGKHKILNQNDTLKLSKACNLWQTIQSLLSQTIEGSLEEEKVPDGLKNKLVAIIEKQDIKTLKSIMAKHRKNVQDIYNKVI
ncbi:MAG: bifunctional [glutamine synthetase] adenylyltransferase/[glutamine synthetase]-adenylyl-L-tyrosine phosphorylase, partial [Alphaproteobacteria bacterium]|nr:bifunctional [glutamine synthetase] adenylyltransferase/[glutamine synthetase]-adenylyl-L-tyrosine phosphorylase [Alphaproteobacteria bacterium]